MELRSTPGAERLFAEPGHRKRDWFKLALGLLVMVAGLLIELPASAIPGAWLALEGGAEVVPERWRGASAALRVAGGLALIAVGVMALWWLILVGLVEPGRYS